MSESPRRVRNVLFVCADDLNGWIGPLGRYPGVHTPHIDKLAARGTHFTHSYCTAPHCNPSRASVFSGQRPTTTGVFLNEALPEAPGRIVLPELFLRNGYEVFGAGKVFHGEFDYDTATRGYHGQAEWRDIHNRPAVWSEFHPCAPEPLPDGRPFNRFFDFRNDEVPPHYALFDWGPLAEHQAQLMPDVQVTEQATEFLTRRHDTPFFCAVGFYRPHLPWYVPRRFFDLYPLDQIRLPFVTERDLDQVPEIARRWARTPDDDHALVVSHGQWRQAVRGYLASISFCDELLGRLMQALDRSGHWNDTAVVLWGDNGFHLGEKLHWRKFTLWEEATRVPLIIAAPGVSQPGRSEHQPVSLLDLYPTLVELTGLAESGQTEGESLVPQLAHGAEPRRSLPVSTWEQVHHSVRSRHWRYTRYADGSEELYDHRVDSHERVNLARRETSAEVKSQLRPHLDALAATAAVG